MINSLESLGQRRRAVRGRLDASEKKMQKLWNGLFHEKDEKLLSAYSPTQRALSFVSSSAAVFDGLLLGWKLYRKFHRRK